MKAESREGDDRHEDLADPRLLSPPSALACSPYHCHLLNWKEQTPGSAGEPTGTWFCGPLLSCTAEAGPSSCASLSLPASKVAWLPPSRVEGPTYLLPHTCELTHAVLLPQHLERPALLPRPVGWWNCHLAKREQGLLSRSQTESSVLTSLANLPAVCEHRPTEEGKTFMGRAASAHVPVLNPER